MTTTNNSLALSLLALVWVHRDRTQPRKWFHWGAMLGGAHHVTVYSDRLRDRDFYTARESGSKTYGWVMVIEMLAWNGQELIDQKVISDLGQCGTLGWRS